MDQIKRQLLLATLLAPVGCAIQPLAPIQNTPLPTPPDPPSPIRPVEIGQTWSYKKFNYYNSALVDRVIETVKSIKTEIEIERLSLTNGALPSEIQTQWGWVKQDPYWETLQTYDDALPIWLDPLDVGVTQLMSTHYQSENNSFKHWINLQTTVVAREKVTLSNGNFETYRIQKIIRLDPANNAKINLIRRDTTWYAPKIGRWVIRETTGQFIINGKHSTPGYEDHFRWELEDWQG